MIVCIGIYTSNSVDICKVVYRAICRAVCKDYCTAIDCMGGYTADCKILPSILVLRVSRALELYIGL